MTLQNNGMKPASDFFRENVALTDQGNSGSSIERAALTVYTMDQIAFQLTNDYWGGASHSFNIGLGGTITVNLSSISTDSRFFAQAALESWTMVSGINFQTVIGNADITFGDSDVGGGAYSSATWWLGNTSFAFVEVEQSWIQFDLGNLESYSFQVYMHEIGHALGLGHAGDYDLSATYKQDGTGNNIYLNDSWQASVMSYFGQSENTFIGDSYAYTATPMIADIIAIQNLYGTVGNLRTSNTTYGESSTAGGYYDTVDLSNMAFTIIDDGGIDTIKFRTETADMNVNLAAESISDIGGLTGNMIIARGTTIENFFSGSGNDTILGNNVANLIKGGAGNDFIKGLGGDDTLKGNKGADTIKGNGGADIIKGNSGNDKLYGGGGADTLFGGIGRDLIFGGNGDDRLDGGRAMDKLIGGAGADTFVFKSGYGKDKIRDFQDNFDTLELDSGLWGGGLTVGEVLTTFGSVDIVKGWVELNFAGGERIIVNGIGDVNALLDDILIV